jgi:dTDP-4-dehydrorhamnose reductase
MRPPTRTSIDARETSCGCPLVHLSTDYVFAGDACRPIPEEAPDDPRSAYGRTKWEGEQAVRATGGEFLIVRSQWIFGRGENFVRTIFGAARKGDPLRVVDDQLGRPTSSRALARGIFAAVDASARGHLHLACEGVATWYDLAVATVEETARRGWLEPVPIEAVSTGAFPRPAPRPPYGVLALERARSLGIAMPYWRDALRDYLDSEEWVSA